MTRTIINPNDEEYYSNSWLFNNKPFLSKDIKDYVGFVYLIIELDTQKKYLGRKWEVEGRVLRGFRRGRKIGFPTCNIDLKNYIIPKNGVYAVNVSCEKVFNKRNGIANIGYRPTFNGKNLLLEVNIFGINKNLYDKKIQIEFKDFIRSEKKFKNVSELKKQIKLDIKKSKK